MADTRNDVTIPVRTWFNLYTATGIVPGTAVSVVNKGSNYILLAQRATAPPNPVGSSAPNIGWPVGVLPDLMAYATVPAGASGLWAWSASGSSVLVQE